ncbi:nucleoside triphosphate pyrophosphohydrolase [Thermodesulfobacteriota bacterium]
MNKDRLSPAILALYELVSKLRGPGGCPWDAQQTDATIKVYLLEEAYEVLDALDNGSPDDVCKELGDLLFQIVFLAKLAEEKMEFDFHDVLESITEKMKTRHPHVFGKETLETPQEVAESWQRIKQQERGKTTPLSAILSDVPSNLPALLRAHRLGERASSSDVEPWGDDPFVGFQEGFEMLKKSKHDHQEADIREIIGKLFFDLAQLTREQGLNAESLLRDTNQKFIDDVRQGEKDFPSFRAGTTKTTTAQIRKSLKPISGKEG